MLNAGADDGSGFTLSEASGALGIEGRDVGIHRGKIGAEVVGIDSAIIWVCALRRRVSLADYGPESTPHAEPLPRTQTIFPFARTVSVAKHGWCFSSATDDALLGDKAAGHPFAACGFS